MSGQDDKIEILGTAKKQYNALMELLRSSGFGGDPYYLLPRELVKFVKRYEELPAVYNSMTFQEALEQYWEQIYIPTELKPQLEKIVDMSKF